jgi:hypothetical protein
MKTNTAGAIVIAVLFFCLLVAIVFCFVQRAEAQRQEKLVERALEQVKLAEQIAQDQRNAAIAAQREAEVQRMMAQQHLIQAEEALAKCRGTK